MRERNRAMLRLLWDSLVRASELCDIRLENCRRNSYDELTGIFTVRTKAKSKKGERHPETKPINPNGSLGALNEWLSVRDKFALPDDPYLFVSQVQTNMETGEYKCGGTGMTRHGLQAILNRLGKQAGVKVSAHDFRRGGATYMHHVLRIDLFKIQQIGGWDSLDVLRGYIEEYEIEQLQTEIWGVAA
jgi:integrase